MRLRWLPFSHISLPLVASLLTQTSLSAHEIRQSALFSKSFAVFHLTLKFSSMLCEPGIRSETAVSNLFFICIQTFCDVCFFLVLSFSYMSFWLFFESDSQWGMLCIFEKLLGCNRWKKETFFVALYNNLSIINDKFKMIQQDYYVF